jgi:MFS transporter, PPP family, 3-phenylpropionic acid transporter
MRLAWPFAVNVLLFASGACLFPYFVLYYQSLGFTGAQIGLLAGVTPLITLVAAPLWTNLADATHRHRLLMSLLILAAASAAFVFPVVRTFAPIALVAVFYSAVAAPIFSFADNATMAMLKGQRSHYGRVRLGGTIGFGVAALLVGVLVERNDMRLAFYTGGAFLFLAFVAVQALDHRREGGPAAKVGRVTDLLADRRWLPFLLVAFAGGLATAVSNSFLFPYLQELGANERTMGLALTIGTLAEVPMFFFGSRLLRRFKPFGLLLLAMALTGARMILFVISATPNFVLMLQFVNGLAFPAMWMAGVAYADEHAPPGLGATAQGLFGAVVFGFGSAVGGFAGGPLLEWVGGRGLFLIIGVAVLVITALAVPLQKRLQAAAREAVPV